MAVLALILASASPGLTAAMTLRTVVPSRPLGATDGLWSDGDTLYVVSSVFDSITKIDVTPGRQPAIVGTLSGVDDAPADKLHGTDDLWIDPLTHDIYLIESIAGVRKIAPDGTRTRVVPAFVDISPQGAGLPNGIAGLRRPGEALRLFITIMTFDPSAVNGVFEVDPNGLLPPRLVYGAEAGVPVYGPGLHGPNSMEFDPQGNEIYVPEVFGGKVWAIDVDAHTARLVYDPQDPSIRLTAVHFGIDGSLLAAVHSSGALLRLDPHGPPDQTPQIVAQLNPGIDGMRQVADGRIFTSSFDEGGVTVVHPDGSHEPLFPVSLDAPGGIALLSDGRLAVGDVGSIAIVDPQSESPTIERFQSFMRAGFDAAPSVATTGGCDGYVPQFFKGTIAYLDLCHPEAPPVDLVPGHTFAGPTSLVARPGELWLVDAGVAIFHMTGVSGAAPLTPVPLTVLPDDGRAMSIANGRLYVPQGRSGVVEVLDPATGALLDTITGLAEPQGVAADESDASIFVLEAGAADSDNLQHHKGRLTRIAADGTRSTIVAGLPTKVFDTAPVIEFFSTLVRTAGGEILMSFPFDGSILGVTP